MEFSTKSYDNFFLNLEKTETRSYIIIIIVVAFSIHRSSFTDFIFLHLFRCHPVYKVNEIETNIEYTMYRPFCHTREKKKRTPLTQMPKYWTLSTHRKWLNQSVQIGLTCCWLNTVFK